MRIVPTSELPADGFSRDLIGADHGEPGVSLIIVDSEPGGGPALHTHPYAELFLVLEGVARFTDGEHTQDIGPGNVVIVGPDEPHGFVNPGPGRLRQLDIHVADRFTTTWLD